LALELCSQVAVSDITALRLHGYRAAVSSVATEPEKWDPQPRETADHSIPYLVAVAFHDGAVTSASFTPERVRDPALRPLIAKMTIDEDKDFTQRFPQEGNCRTEVTTISGQRLVAHTAYPKGHQRHPLSDAELEAKFRRLAEAVLTEQQRSTALELLWAVERLPNLQALFDILVV
jgi:2-methylcitrate dehydratase